MRILIRIIALPLSRFILPIALSLVVAFSSTQAQPVISSVSPTQNDTNGDSAADVTVTFSDNMLVGAAGTFVIHGSLTGNRTGSGVYGGAGTTILSFNPTTDFSPGEEVEITLTTGIQNTGATSLADAFVWKYIVAAGVAAADFSDQSSFGTGSDDTQAVVFADVDGDGDLDILVGNGGAAKKANTVALNDGTGTFTAGTTFGTGADVTYALAVGDGDLDVAAGNLSAQNTVYLNDGSGSFTVRSNNFGVGNDETRSMVFGDVDGDGDGAVDLAVGNDLEQNVIYLNDGTGDFTAGTVNFGTGSDQTYSLVFADVDGDGDLDLIVGNENEQNVAYLNNGMGSFDTIINFGTGGDVTKAVATGITILVATRSVDDIPPAPVTDGAVDGEAVLSWTLSADDRPVGFVPYRGFAIPIPGVKRYQIGGGCVGRDAGGADRCSCGDVNCACECECVPG